MITINPIKLTNKTISFGTHQANNTASKVGLLTLDKNPSNKINFEKDMYITAKADSVQSNPLKALGYNIVKAYNILCTPKRPVVATQTESKYIHIPYMA